MQTRRRNDIGAHGGPGACNWRKTPFFELTVSPVPVKTPGPVTFTTFGGDPGRPACLFVFDSTGRQLLLHVPVLGVFCPMGTWALPLIAPKFTMQPSFTFKTLTLDRNGRVQSTPGLVVTLLGC